MLQKIYNKLLKHFGEQNWWPTISDNKEFEVCIGAILTQNTAWKNVEKAVASLNERNLISINSINNSSEKELAQLIRPSGYYNQKARKLKNFCKYVIDNYDGDLKKFFSSGSLREELLSINGVGNETADSIILYSAKKPVFVIDAYTKRIVARMGIINSNSSYGEVQQLFMKNLKKEETLYNEYHALLVMLGKNYCRKKPECQKCPVRGDCKQKI